MPLISEHGTNARPDQGLLGDVTYLEPIDRSQFYAGGSRRSHQVHYAAHQLFDQHMFFERLDDLPVVIQPQIGSLIGWDWL